MKCLNTFFLALLLWCVSASYTNIQDELINKWKSIGVQYCQTFPPLGPIPAKYPALMNLINQFASNISLLTIVTGVPSVTVNLIYDQDTLWSKGYGLKNLSNPKAGAPNGDTPYQIGSNSKLFTTLLALIAQDKGMLSFSDEVVTHVPEFEPNSPFPSKRSINFAQLASHMAGLPRESPCEAIHSKCNFTNDQMWARVQNVTLVNPPDFVPSYSNLGFAVLGHAVEEIWGTNWADLIQQEIFSPLGMINSGATLDENFWQNRAVGYTYQNAQASVVDLGWESPAGGIYSTANDMSKFVSFLFRDDVPYMAQPDQILDAMSIREWRQLKYINVDLTGYGMPWEIFNSPIIYTKAGSINGYVSLTITVPRLKLGLVILQSSDVAATLSDIFGLFLTYFVKSFAGILLEVAPAPYIPPNFNSFEGTYYFANNTVQIYQVQSSNNYTVPLINYSGLVLQLQFVSENVFKISTQDVPLTCFYAQSGIEQYINLIPSSPPSFTIPGLAPGAVAVKVS